MDRFSVDAPSFLDGSMGPVIGIKAPERFVEIDDKGNRIFVEDRYIGPEVYFGPSEERRRTLGTFAGLKAFETTSERQGDKA